MASALLVGAFGQRNPGDDALLTSFARALHDWELVATSTDPALTTTASGVPAVATGQPLAVLRALHRADAVVFAGGTVFKVLPASTGRTPGDLLRKAVALALVARRLHKRVALVGVGVGALPDVASQRLARRLVAASDLLVLRDEESARALGAIGVPGPLRVGADAAWPLLAEPPPAPDEPGRRRAVVAVSHHTGTGDDVVASLVAGCEHLLGLDLPVDLQPWQVGSPGQDDLDLARCVEAQVRGGAVDARGLQVVPPPASLVAARDGYLDARLVVGQRFHALVAAAAAGARTLAVTHEAKLAGLARRTGQPTVSPSAAPDELAAALDGALAGQAPRPATVRAEAAVAEEGFGLLRLLLSAGESPGADDVSGLRLEPS